MKTKIAAILTAILSALLVSDVHAYQAYEGTFYEAEKIEGVYFYQYLNNTDTKNQYNDYHSQATIYRKTTDNNVVYSVEALKPINGMPNGSHLITNREYPNSWEPAAATRIEALAYYGYGYKEDGYDHTDPKWYAVTQYLIWLSTSSNIRCHFTSSISSTTPTYPFEYEIGELIYLTDQHIKTPFFEDYENKKNLEVGKRIILKDLQGAIYYYQKIESPTLNVEKISYDELAITAPTEGEHYLYLLKSYNYYDGLLTYYRSDEYQDMLERGNIPLKKETYSFTAKSPEGSITTPEKNDNGTDSKEDDQTSQKEETPNDSDNKENPPLSDKPEDTKDEENKEEYPPVSEDQTSDKKDEDENKKEPEDENLPPKEETPNDSDNKETTSSSDKTEDIEDVENKEENPSLSDDKTSNTEDEGEEKKDNEEVKKPSKDEIQNPPDSKVEIIPSLSHGENNNKPEKFVDDKLNTDDNVKTESIDINKEEKENVKKIPNEFLNDKQESKDNEELLNKEYVDKLDNTYEPIEVEVPATDASVLSIIFYLLSIFGLLFIKHAK